jgi:putative transposase
MDSCVLNELSLAAFVTEAMHHFDGEHYELDSYVVMPNHVHVLIRPTVCEAHPLERIVGSWKQFSARRIGEVTAEGGNLWQDEGFDRIIRDEEHLYRALQYIGRNPAKAGLARGACPLWVRPEWEALGWKFEISE